MILNAIVCVFKGHEIDPDESIVGDTMIDKRNWLCKCHRCGLYIMHDGAMSGQSIVMTKREAYEIKREFEQEFVNTIYSPHIRFRRQTEGL